MGKVVLTTGVFDCGMHIGHFMLLLKCRDIAGPDGTVIVGVNSDSSAVAYKRKPIFEFNYRIECVRKLPFVNSAFMISEEVDIEKKIKENKVDFYVKGSEWADKKITGSDKCSIVLINPLTVMSQLKDYKVSTSEIIERIKKYESNNTDQKNN